MKRIIHIISGLEAGGAESILYNLVKSDKKNKHLVISLSGHGSYGNLLLKVGIESYFLNLKDVKKAIFELLKLIIIIRNSKADIVQTWMYHSDFIGGLTARIFTSAKIIWSIHSDTLIKERSKSLTYNLFLFNKYLSYIIPNAIIYCSNSSLINHNKFGYCKKKSYLIYNGIETDRFVYSLEKRKIFRKKFGISEKSFLIGMISRYDPLKDHETLLKSLSELIPLSKKEIYCILIGSNIYKNKFLLKQIRSKGLKKKVILLKPISNIEDLMTALDCHILCSHSESLPNVISEAMSCCIPTISSNVGDIKNIVGKFGYIVEPYDHKSLTNKMLLLMNKNHKDLISLKKHGRLRIKKNFSLKTMKRNYLNFWNNILSD